MKLAMLAMSNETFYLIFKHCVLIFSRISSNQKPEIFFENYKYSKLFIWDLYTISKRKFNFKLIFVNLFLEMLREVVKSGFAIVIFAVEVNLEGLCFSHDEIDDF